MAPVVDSNCGSPHCIETPKSEASTSESRHLGRSERKKKRLPRGNCVVGRVSVWGRERADSYGNSLQSSLYNP